MSVAEVAQVQGAVEEEQIAAEAVQHQVGIEHIGAADAQMGVDVAGHQQGQRVGHGLCGVNVGVGVVVVPEILRWGLLRQRRSGE